MSSSPQIQESPSKLWSSFRSVVALLPPERVAALEKLASEDPELHHRLLRLLRHDEAADAVGFLVVPEPAKPAAPVPRALGPYQLIEELGRGGMGTVWRARHTRLNKIVAVKVLSDSLTQDATALARFNREMQAVGSLEHPNIVRALDADECNGTHYLVMELVEGIDLARVVRSRGPLPVGEACEYARQAAVGLAYAHDRGLVHRDIKPSNLLLSVSSDSGSRRETGAATPQRVVQGSTSHLFRTTLKILDMGLARLQSSTDSQASEVTRFGQILGTPDYMAPEQWTDMRAVDGRADLYSLGCTLFHLLAGRGPFQTPENQPIGRKILAHTMDPIPDVRTLRPEVPEAVAAIVQKLMAKRPQDRYESAAKLAAELQTFATTQFGSASPLDEAMRPTSDPSSVATVPMNASTIRQLGVSSDHRVRRLALWSLWVTGCVAALWLVALFLSYGFGTKTSNRDLAAAGSSPTQSTQSAALVPEKTPESPVNSSSGDTTESPAAVTSSGSNESGNSQPAKIVNDQPASTKTPEAPIEQAVSPKADPPRQVALAPEPRPDRVDLPEEPLPGSVVSAPPVEKEPERKPLREIAWLKLKLVHCPAGSFRMGSSEADKDAKPDETPQVDVTLSEFWLGQTEITQEQWKTVMGTDLWKLAGPAKNVPQVMEGPEFPASSITWTDAVEFCRRLNDKERREGRLTPDLKYSLPTEAQWEYACRAGSTTRFSFGDNESELLHYAWFGANSGRGNVRDDELYPHRVAERKPNAWGLYDMHGNVHEWCLDAYQTALTPGTNPHVLGGPSHVYRGGSWLSYAEDCRSAKRYFFYLVKMKRDPADQFAFKNSPILGFRLALVQNGPPQ